MAAARAAAKPIVSVLLIAQPGANSTWLDGILFNTPCSGVMEYGGSTQLDPKPSNWATAALGPTIATVWVVVKGRMSASFLSRTMASRPASRHSA